MRQKIYTTHRKKRVGYTHDKMADYNYGKDKTKKEQLLIA
jgi:hypothetical protein